MDFGYNAPDQQPMLFPGTIAGTVIQVGEGVKVVVGQKVRALRLAFRRCEPTEPSLLPPLTQVVVSNLKFDIAYLASQEVVLAEGDCIMPVRSLSPLRALGRTEH